MIAEGAQRAEKTVPVPESPCPPSLLKSPVIAYSSGLLSNKLMDTCSKKNDEVIIFSSVELKL